MKIWDSVYICQCEEKSKQFDKMQNDNWRLMLLNSDLSYAMIWTDNTSGKQTWQKQKVENIFAPSKIWIAELPIQIW